MFAKLCKLINERAEEREARKAEEARKARFYTVGTMTVIVDQAFIWSDRWHRTRVKVFLQENLNGERKYLAGDSDFQNEVRTFPPLVAWMAGGTEDEMRYMMEHLRAPAYA